MRSLGDRKGPARRGRSPIASAVLGGVIVAACLAAAWVAWVAPTVLPDLSNYTVRAEFDRLAGLGEHNDVRIAGRRVGKVLAARTEDGRPVVDLRLNPGAGPLPVDTRAVVRSQGLLGQRYLELRPGSSSDVLAEGASIPAEQTHAMVDLPEFLDTFNRRTRDGLGETVEGLGGGLAGRGEDLGETIERAPGMLADLRSLARTTLEREGAVSRLVPSIRSATAAVDPVRDEFAAGFAPQADALAVLAREREAIESVLETAPAQLSGTRSGLAAGRPLLDEAGRLVRSVNVTFENAPRGLDEAARLLLESQGPLRRTSDLLADVRRTVPPVVDLSGHIVRSLPSLDRGLVESLPTLDTLGRYSCDVAGWAENWRGSLALGSPDDNPLGYLTTFRLTPIATPESLQELGQKGPSPLIAKNPYPRPCEAGEVPLP